MSTGEQRESSEVAAGESALAAGKQRVRGKPFPKGTSGNANGRIKGRPTRATVLAQQMIDGEGAQIIRKVLDLAKTGDKVCLRLVMERLVPPRRERPLEIDLPELTKPEDLVAASAAIFAAVATGDIMASEAAALGSVVSTVGKAMETRDLADRIAALEAQAAKGN